MAAAGGSWTKGRFTPAKGTQYPSTSSSAQGFTESRYDVPNGKGTRYEADDHYKEAFAPFSQFTNPEEDALDAYQDGEYTNINKSLWTASTTHPAVKDIDSAMNQSKTPESILAFRSIDVGHPMHSMLTQMNTGDEYRSKGYDSTSVAGTFDGGDTRITYRVPPGVKAIYMNARTRNTHVRERELLIARNTRWKLSEKVVQSDGSIRAIMDFVSQD